MLVQDRKQEQLNYSNVYHFTGHPLGYQVSGISFADTSVCAIKPNIRHPGNTGSEQNNVLGCDIFCNNKGLLRKIFLALKRSELKR